MKGTERIQSQVCSLCGESNISQTALPGIFRCGSCTALLNQRSHERAEEERVYLDKPFDTDLDLSQTQFEWFRATTTEQKPYEKRLLDFGCGTGGFLFHAAQNGWSVEGIELNPESARTASSRLGPVIFSGSFYEYPGPQQPLHVVTFWDSLDHLLQPDEALARVHQWLMLGGDVIVRVRNGTWHYWVRRAQTLLNKLGFLKSRRYVGVIHRYGFTRKSLKQLLTKQGFGDISWQPADFTPKDRYGWMNSLRLKKALLGFYTRIARVLFHLSGGRVYLFSSIVVRARSK